MATSLETVRSVFVMPRASESEALRAFQQALTAALPAIAEASTLDQAFSQLGWSCDRDGLGCMATLHVGGEPPEGVSWETLLGALAPYVGAGSFLEVEDATGETWRWSFHRGRLVTEDVDPWEDETENLFR